METEKHLSLAELEAGIDAVRRSPKDNGVLNMIVRRPRDDEREVVESGKLDPLQGLVGDNWKVRGSKSTADGSANINMQLTIMNSRTIALVAQEQERWPLAGDQLYIDMDLSVDNLPPGTRLALGTAIIEVSAQPHTGCWKFSSRFGADAMKLVNSPEGKQLHLRGINAKVVQAGTIHVDDIVRKI